MFVDDDGRLNELMKLPALRGPALSIFVALLIAGKPLEAQELAVFTGYENQAITKGLKRLKVLRAIIDRGRYGGWELAPNWRQLPLPLLFAGNHDFNQSNHDFHDSNHDFHDSPHTRDLLLTTTTTLGKEEVVVVTREANHDFNSQPVDNSKIREWLIKGGIGPDSPKMHQLLAQAFDEDFVRAHVLARLAAVEEKDSRYGVGMLITKLEARDPAPAMRCETCFKPERECRCNGRQYIPEQLRGIIKR